MKLPVTFISYTHGGSGYLSLSFKSSIHAENADTAKGIESAVNRSALEFNLEDVVFRGVVKSVISKKNGVSFTVHMKPDRITVAKFYDLVGKSGLSFTFRDDEVKAANRKMYLSRAEYISLKTEVEEKLRRMAAISGEDEGDILAKLTAYKERQGVRTLEGMSPARLGYLRKRFDFMLKKREENFYRE